MQFPYGYPTPPTSPSPFDAPKCTLQQQQQQAPILPCQQPRFVPPAPEERLGRFLAGTLQLTGILGTGAYGVVYAAVDIKTHVRYAVKTLSKYNLDGTPLDRRQEAFQNREIRLHWRASSHPNVVSMLKIIDDPDCVYVILEYCPEGDLFYNITECGQYVGKDDLAKDVFLQILDAVEHCHSQGIYHRDLKPENILVSNNGETVKLADFGLATSSDRSEDYGCGSTFYMSPECLDHTTRRPFYFCAPNDVWSLGVILVNLTCGRNPWKQASFEDSTYRAYTRSQGFLKTILPVSDELNDILGRIFTRNPDERITIPELKARIRACTKFTEQPQPTILQTSQAQSQVQAPIPAPALPEHITSYVDCEDAILDDEDDEEFDYDNNYDAPLSPASSDDSLSDGSCSSDAGSVTSSCSSMEDLEEDDDDELSCPEPRGAITPPPQHPEGTGPTMIYDPEAPLHVVGFSSEYVHQHHQFAGQQPPEPVVSMPAMAPMAQMGQMAPMAPLQHQQRPIQAPQQEPMQQQQHQQQPIAMPVPIHLPFQHQYQQHGCAPKGPYLHLPYFLDAIYKYGHPVPLHHPHPVPFQQVPPMFAACY